jgi:hypothetical protein
MKAFRSALAVLMVVSTAALARDPDGRFEQSPLKPVRSAQVRQWPMLLQR